MHPIFVASVVTAIPYLNVAFSRADVSHLAQAIFPLLIGLMTFPWPARLKWPIYGVALPVIAAGHDAVASGLCFANAAWMADSVRAQR